MNIEKPRISDVYTTHMSGVDRADQLPSFIALGGRQKSGYIIWFLFNTSVCNAFVLESENVGTSLAMSQYTELEKLKVVVATKVVPAFESVKIAECVGNEFDKTARFQKPTTVNEIGQRERDRIPKKTRQSTAWSDNFYQAWVE